jgi:dienelactone hydrolase
MDASEHERLPGGASAMLARPPGTPNRGIVILPSMPGTTPVFEEMARQLTASYGWAVCVPEIITEDPAARFEQRRLTVATIEDKGVFRTITEAAAATGATDVALIGFCVGGMYAMKASSLRIFDRIVAFYGMVRIPEYWRSPHQGEPLEYLAEDSDSVLAIFGEQDEFIPVADIATLEAAGVRTIRYPAAGHAFAHDPDGHHYRAQDAADAWRRALDFISNDHAATA